MRKSALQSSRSGTPAFNGVPTISDAEFAAFRELIRRTAGITLSDMKRQLLCSRLSRRLRHHGMQRFGEYYELLRSRDPKGEELRQMVNCVTTNKTHFFREPHHFDFLGERVFPEVAARSPRGAPHRLRIWSAGCSTGEEPYSIAITVAERLRQLSAWNVRILASDIDTQVLEHAEAGIYSADSAAELPPQSRAQWFESVPEHDDALSVRDELRQMIAFRRINLVDERWPINTTFDVIFCRNVTIYFDRATQERLYTRFAQMLRPGGYLIAGHSEHLGWLSHLFTALGKTVYQKPHGSSVAPNAAPVAQRRSVRPKRPSVAPRYAEARVVSGEVFASREPTLVHTLLGSCVSVCLFDPVARIGGLNHFMLPSGANDAIQSAAYGVNAMELLINRIMSLGGSRDRLQARVFGGANVILRRLGPSVAEANARFALEFLKRENIAILERRLGGSQPLRISLFTKTGEVRVRVVGDAVERVALAEARHATEIERQLTAPAPDRLTLF